MKKNWLDKKENIFKIYIFLWLIGIILVILDLFIHRHEQLKFTEFFSFYAIYGFLGCVVLVLAAKILRKIVMRKEDYYD